MAVHPVEILSPTSVTVTLVSRSSDFLSKRIVKASLFMLGDLCALALAYWAAGASAADFFRVARSSLGPAAYPMFFVPFCAAIFYLMDGYGMADLRRPEHELELSFKAVSFSLLSLLAANVILFKGEPFSRYFIFLWYAFALMFVLCVRFGLRGFYGWTWRRGRALNRALFIGQGHELDYFRTVLSVQRHKAYQIVAAVITNAFENPVIAETITPVSDGARWANVAESENARVAILGRSVCNAGDECVREILASCTRHKLSVILLADTFFPSGMRRQLDYFTGSSYLTPEARWHNLLQQLCKRLIDLLFGVAGSGVTLLLTPIVGLLINLEDRGPIFHLREFVTCDGETRYYRKFRTMVINADQILQNNQELKSRFTDNHKLRDDPRVLRFGRFLRKYSIDEFPQFFSLLTGRLSLVGPRVISQAEKGRYGESLSRRLSVKPGMTGYWQVMGRQTTTYDERVHMDNFYVNHWSIWLDLYIIARTFGKLLWPEGAY